MRFTLRSLFIAVALLCLFCAFPWFVSGVVALFIACSLVGGLFILLVFTPLERAMENLRRTRLYRD
jgi:hypothetical protein